MDDFIGTTFNDGKLVVTGWNGERLCNSSKVYQCHCSVCSGDKELFGDAVFKSTKRSLVTGSLPCGCSKQTRWSADQYRVLISRKASGKYSAVVPDDAKNYTKVSCTCNAVGCGRTWEASITNLLSVGTGCKKCAYKTRTIPESTAIERVLKICSEKNFRFLGFKDGWNGSHSRLLLTCHCGHTWSPIYTDVVNTGCGCPSCAKTGYDSSKRGWLYCYLWTNPDTNEQFLKYGITNYPKQRLTQQKSNTKYKPKQLCSIPFDDGEIPPDIERAIDLHKRSNNIPSPVTKEMFPDGHTETLPIEEWSFIANLIQNETMCRLTPL